MMQGYFRNRFQVMMAIGLMIPALALYNRAFLSPFLTLGLIVAGGAITGLGWIKWAKAKAVQDETDEVLGIDSRDNHEQL